MNLPQKSKPLGSGGSMQSAERIEGAANDNERVDEAISESFPASDPPSWTSGIERHLDEEGDEKQAGEKSGAG